MGTHPIFESDFDCLTEMANVVAPTKWKIGTLETIKSANRLNSNIKTKIRMGHINDPLPSFHDQCIVESNTKIIRYMREVRRVVMNLRERLSEANEETKSLGKTEQVLERCLEHMIKDEQINRQTTKLRATKPKRELIPDQADSVLELERKTLRESKTTLTRLLAEAQETLKDLDRNRKELNHIMNERNQVLDLLNQTVQPGTRVTKGAGSVMLETTSDMIINTPDAIRVDAEMAKTIRTSSALRSRAKSTMAKLYERQKVMSEKVNNSLNEKVAETIMLEQRLSSAQCQNRATTNKLQRHLEMTKQSEGYLIGPENSEDIELRQLITRPAVKIYQRHHGTELREGRRVNQARNHLNFSIDETNNQLAQLRRANTDITMDFRDKRVSSSIDASLLRMRRQHSNHRWVMGNDRLSSGVKSRHFPHKRNASATAAEAIIETSTVRPWYNA